jgi:hypothetical protein
MSPVGYPTGYENDGPVIAVLLALMAGFTIWSVTPQGEQYWEQSRRERIAQEYSKSGILEQRAEPCHCR